ncbi:NADP-dependent oxidoreductase [Pseudomonas sp. N040]|uniref:NADP-dependent oxidoreductase n=1 Tax=Pseudomonas sp. N040 TaxID=2785325 RepID=UPI0018A25319|nr:NADP-dependent oxidoreductase [Pseudomonas sp. N040]MBF7731566.1 NADP-dependent oxidoreductase [Pseudomonas sp. N040]MBW7015210.1 NADP-dependent oxidoreductase [Pseudomonas sp. N040]
MTGNCQFILARIPSGALMADCFRLEQAAMPVPKDGEVLLKARYMSIDAASRAWMQGATYRDALGAESLMAGRALAEVLESRHPDFTAGELVFAEFGWQQYAALPAQALRKQPACTPLSHLLSVYGVSGLTAYFGLTEVGQAKSGDTVVISAAAGAVGVFAGQIAKALGCRVVGIAGSEDKCCWLREELGLDAALNYKAGALADKLKAACPNGIDVYFDNVGGPILETALTLMNLHGRIVCCGAVSAYDSGVPAPGLCGVPFQLVVKRLSMRGFIVSDFFGQLDEAQAQLHAWVEQGAIRVFEDIIDGFDSLPAALIGLLHGENRGKRMVKIS